MGRTVTIQYDSMPIGRIGSDTRLVARLYRMLREPFSVHEVIMPKEEPIEIEGIVSQALANTQFRVKLDGGHEIIAHVAGRMRKHFIRIVPGDKVRVELSPYDLDKGRIVYRQR